MEPPPLPKRVVEAEKTVEYPEYSTSPRLPERIPNFEKNYLQISLTGMLYFWKILVKFPKVISANLFPIDQTIIPSELLVTCSTLSSGDLISNLCRQSFMPR